MYNEDTIDTSCNYSAYTRVNFITLSIQPNLRYLLDIAQRLKKKKNISEPFTLFLAGIESFVSLHFELFRGCLVIRSMTLASQDRALGLAPLYQPHLQPFKNSSREKKKWVFNAVRILNWMRRREREEEKILNPSYLLTVKLLGLRPRHKRQLGQERQDWTGELEKL